ncbi:putative epoxide hydrolase [Lepidopterella palustris CBS 459.81]|uniref:Putative epoxide hydrolase n=1 Tax=Lepidopterella palustris CBS 459.81 TaxID=1314670 RepID=A0A8E2JL12_9PEZI|nr:putative epoxide hydrolase [Lepidopterella palustris CBS 459.81]
MPGSYSAIPSGATSKPEPFTLSVPEQELSEFKTLLKLSKLGPATWEGKQEDRRFGVTHEWMTNAKDYWLNKFDWRAQEKHINSFPNFKLAIKDDDGEEYSVHFAALFSEKKDAIPIAFLHGWPGSFLEFLPILGLLKKKYSPKELPYHVIVPSLPGYTLSSGGPLNKDFTTGDTARIIHKLMTQLGLGGGYIVQGGDVGSFVGRILAHEYDACKALHLNMLVVVPPPADAEITQSEKEGLARMKGFYDHGRAYALEHGTRPSTIGHVLSSSPLALLAWIGEKFLEWTDADPTLDQILESVSLYWFTSAFPRSIYPYRGLFGPNTRPDPYCDKPLGFSYFPLELAPAPKAWVASKGNLVFHREHEKGGHFAAMECPDLLLQDVEDFAKQVWTV